MKVTILTLGSRGDVQPYIALAREMIKIGHEVVICTGATFQHFIEENKVSFHPAATDLMAIMESEEGRDILNGKKFSPFKIMKFSKEKLLHPTEEVWMILSGFPRSRSNHLSS
ncbi:hypothetical protein F6Y02_01080 [Bacillus megaterium]|nr:hypothetical protein [Priestia megaterium]